MSQNVAGYFCEQGNGKRCWIATHAHLLRCHERSPAEGWRALETLRDALLVEKRDALLVEKRDALLAKAGLKRLPAN